MGFRTYLMSIPKSVWLEIKDKPEEELAKEFGDGEYFSFRDLPGIIELYEIGKAWDFDEEKFTTNFFTNESFESDLLFSMANKEFLEEIIENYRQKVITYHKNIYNIITNISPKELREYKLKRITKNQDINDDLNDDLKIKEVVSYNDDDLKIKEVVSYFDEKILEWDTFIPYTLRNNTDEITTSWKYEYVIFELVRIYKTFDWNNNILIWVGW